jgi:hypothetical protein
MRKPSKDKALFATGEMIQLLILTGNKPTEVAHQLGLIAELLKRKATPSLYSLTSERIAAQLKTAGIECVANAHSDLIIETAALVLSSSRGVVLAFNEAKAKKEKAEAELEALKT